MTHRGSSERVWTNQQTQLIGTNSITINAKDTTLIGAVVANASIANDGSLTDKGGLKLTTETLVVDDLLDTETADSRGINTGVTFNVSGQDGPSLPGLMDTGSTTIGGFVSGHEREQQTRATIGGGSLVVGGVEQTTENSTVAVNRDLTQSQVVTVDRETGGLNASVTVDHRLLSEDGRQSIANNFEDTADHAAGFGRTVKAVAESEHLSLLEGFVQTFSNDVQIVAFKHELERNPEFEALRGKLSSMDNPDVFTEGMMELMAVAKDRYGIEPGDLAIYNADKTSSLSLQDIGRDGQLLIDTQGGTLSDRSNSEYGTSFVDVSNSNSKRQQITTTGTELLRAAELDGNNILSVMKDVMAQNDLSKVFGDHFGSSIDSVVEGGLDNGVSARFYEQQRNSNTAMAGTQRADTVGNASVLYRQVHTREVAIIERTADAFAKQHNLTPDQARRELTQTALGMVDAQWAAQPHVRENSSERARVALLNAAEGEKPISLPSLGKGWFDAKEIELFTADEADFRDTYLLSPEVRTIESGALDYVLGERIITPTNGYISRYGLAEGSQPLEGAGALVVTGKIMNDAGETTAGLLTAVAGRGVVGLTQDVAVNLAGSVLDQAADCAARGPKCFTPNSLTHGNAIDHRKVNSLQQDRIGILNNTAEIVTTSAEVGSLVVTGGTAVLATKLGVSAGSKFYEELATPADTTKRGHGEIPGSIFAETRIAADGEMIGQGQPSYSKVVERVEAVIPDTSSAVRVHIETNIAESKAGTKSSKFTGHFKAEGRVQEKYEIWPPNRGGYGPIEKITIQPGELLDRYGFPGGTFVSPAKSTLKADNPAFETRALPSYKRHDPYNIYEVLKPIEDAPRSKILPWFGQPGQGVQFDLPHSVTWYIENGYLKQTGGGSEEVRTGQ